MSATTASPAAPQFSDNDLAWLAVLAGTQQPNAQDPEQRQAAQLRGYFAQRDAQELAHPLPSATQARLMQRLREQGAFKPPAPTLARQLQALVDWLLPSGPGVGTRYALVAGVAMAVVVVPALLRQSPPPVDDGYKSLPRMAPQPDGGTQLMLVPQPALQVQQLQAALQPLGATVQVLAQDQGYQLLASVPPAQQAAAQQALQPWGLALTAQGLLRVNIQPTGQRP